MWPIFKPWRKWGDVNTVHRHLTEQNDYWCKTPVLLWMLILLVATTKNLAGPYAHLASLPCQPVCLVSLPALFVPTTNTHVLFKWIFCTNKPWASYFSVASMIRSLLQNRPRHTHLLCLWKSSLYNHTSLARLKEKSFKTLTPDGVWLDLAASEPQTTVASVVEW